jgi:hypothetical protein
LQESKGRVTKLPRRSFLHLAAGAAALPTVSRIARAQAYPTRPVRIIVPAAAGGVADIVARLTGQALSGRVGQPFIIENRPVAGTIAGTEAAVHAPADGYTLLLIAAASVIAPLLYDKVNFDIIRDIAPVGSIISIPLVMVVNPAVPAKTVPDFIALCQGQPRQARHGVSWQWKLAPGRRRTVQDDDWRRYDPCAVSRRSARSYRSHRWASADHVRNCARVHRQAIDSIGESCAFQEPTGNDTV